MTVGYLIKENGEDAEKIYYDFDDIENGNKLYRDQFWTGTTNNLKWYEVEPPKPISFWDTDLVKLLKYTIICYSAMIIHLYLYIATLHVILTVISWSDQEFRRGGGTVLVWLSLPFYIMSVPYFINLVISYI